MMILALKSSFRSRVFLRPVLFLSQPFSSTSADSPAFHFHPPSSEAVSPSLVPTGPNSEFRAPNSVFSASRSKNPNFDQIFKILRSRNVEDRQSIETADLALTKLGFRISESFVLAVLRYGSDILSCLKFFEWAGVQRGFRHTNATSQALFKILSRAKLTPSMFNLLDNFNSLRKARKRPLYDSLLVIGYAVAGKPQISLQLMGRLRFAGLEPNPIAYNVVLNALVECRCFDMANVLLNQMKIRGYENEITHFIAVKSLCRQNHLDEAGELEDAFEFLQGRKANEGYIPKVFHYNLLIFKLLKENRLMDAFDLLMEMKELQIVPDKFTMNTVMCSFCKAGVVDVGLEIYGKQAEFVDLVR